MDSCSRRQRAVRCGGTTLGEVRCGSLRPHGPGVPGLRFHDLRHTGSTLAAAFGRAAQGVDGTRPPLHRGRGAPLSARRQRPGRRGRGSATPPWSRRSAISTSSTARTTRSRRDLIGLAQHAALQVGDASSDRDAPPSREFLDSTQRARNQARGPSKYRPEYRKPSATRADASGDDGTRTHDFLLAKQPERQPRAGRISRRRR